jgi:hypothetical protein
MCVATALPISACLLAIQIQIHPYKSTALERLQTLALTTLALFYFIGLLMKKDSVDESDKGDLGVLTVLLMVAIFVATATALLLEMCSVVCIQWARLVLQAFTIMFEGNIRLKEGGKCVASFPGKYEDGWNSIIKLSGNSIAKVSVACVFLPMLTPRFGTHEIDVECKEGSCYCFAIYGAKKVWGCGWWLEWKKNMLLAHRRRQKFQVFYFKGQVRVLPMLVGQGKIKWENCAKHALLREKVVSNWPKVHCILFGTWWASLIAGASLVG